MITEETRRSFGLDDTQLLKWRKGGRAQKAKTFLLVAGVVLMILLGIRMLAGAPLPQYGGLGIGRQGGTGEPTARVTPQWKPTGDQQAKN